MLLILALLAATPLEITEVAAVSGDQPAAETWTFQRADHVTRSSTQGFSTDWRSQGQVVLRRDPGGSVTVEDVGESRDRSWDETWGQGVETTTWRTTWRGTWRSDGDDDGAVLTMQRTGRSCEVTQVRDRMPTETRLRNDNYNSPSTTTITPHRVVAPRRHAVGTKSC